MVYEGPLGRTVPPDWEHIEKYPLSAVSTPPKPVPVILGVNWYPAFDRPEQDATTGKWRVRLKDGESARGGHAVCLLPAGVIDHAVWWDFYNQIREGSCVGQASSRAKTLMDRTRFDAKWLWNESKKIDVWADTNPGDNNGTSVRAAMDVLRSQGHKTPKRETPDTKYGISANRWAANASEILAALGTPDRDYAILLNSWGRAYPHFTRVSAEDLERLVAREDGEAAVPTDS